jgi:hypothetical protein
MTEGAALPLAGEPRAINGVGRERIVYAPVEGVLHSDLQIGQPVSGDDLLATIDGTPLYAPISGTLRGLTRPGVPVARGDKALEVDPRPPSGPGSAVWASGRGASQPVSRSPSVSGWRPLMQHNGDVDRQAAGARPPLAQIADVFVRYANFTLGGGSATTAVIHGEIVGKRHWVSEEQFALSFALGRLTPGTNLLAFCVGIGWILRRWAGAAVALLAASIPCTVLAILITVLFAQWQENPFAKQRSRARSPRPSR